MINYGKYNCYNWHYEEETSEMSTFELDASATALRYQR